MSTLLAAQIEITLDHLLDDVAIAYLCANDLSSGGAERFIKSKVAHDSGDNGILSQSSCSEKVHGRDSENFVPVYQLSCLIAEQDAISIAIVGDTNMGTTLPNNALNFLWEGAAALHVDVGSIGFVMRDRQVRTELAQNTGRRFVRGAIRHINRDVHFFQRHAAWETSLGKFHVTPERVVDPGGAPDFARSRPDVFDLAGEDQALDFFLHLIVQLV